MPEYQFILVLIDKLGPTLSVALIVGFAYFKFNSGSGGNGRCGAHDSIIKGIEDRLKKGDEGFVKFHTTLDEVRRKVAVLFDRSERSNGKK